MNLCPTPHYDSEEDFSVDYDHPPNYINQDDTSDSREITKDKSSDNDASAMDTCKTGKIEINTQT